MQPLHDAVGLRPADPVALIFDAFQLQEQLIRMLVLTAAELAAIVAQDGHAPGVILLEGWQHIVVEQLHRGHRQLVGIEPPPGLAVGATPVRPTVR